MSRVRLHGFDAICVSKNSSARNGFVTKDCRQITIRNTGAGIKSDAAAVRRGTRCGAFRRTNRLGGRRGTGAAHRHRTGCRHGRGCGLCLLRGLDYERLALNAGLCEPPDSLIAPVAFRSVSSAVLYPNPLDCIFSADCTGVAVISIATGITTQIFYCIKVLFWSFQTKVPAGIWIRNNFVYLCFINR